MQKINAKNHVLEQHVEYLESPFGKRKYKGVTAMHNGDDIIGKGYSSDWVIAIDDGIVKENTYSNSRGYYVGIKMNNGYLTRYLHLKKGSILVKKGDKVTKGQRIAHMGNSGFYNGEPVNTHLHFAVVNTNNSFVDPMPYLLGDKNFGTTWEKGDYKVLYQKYLRTSPEVANNKVKYKNLTANAKKKCSKDSLGYARYIIGAIVNIKEFKYDKKGNLWGRTNTLWLCVEDSSGKQVIKV